MATLIRFKRKKKKSNSEVLLYPGEPFYDLESNHLYVGKLNKNGDSDTKVDVKQMKHIAEVTFREDGKFQIGDDEDNVIDVIGTGVALNQITWEKF